MGGSNPSLSCQCIFCKSWVPNCLSPIGMRSSACPSYRLGRASRRERGAFVRENPSIRTCERFPGTRERWNVPRETPHTTMTTVHPRVGTAHHAGATLQTTGWAG